jgi:hypothetical protein
MNQVGQQPEHCPYSFDLSGPFGPVWGIYLNQFHESILAPQELCQL